MKLYLNNKSLIGLAIALAFLPVFVFASPDQLTKAERSTVPASESAVQQKVITLKDRALKEIDRRLTSLSRLSDKIGEIDKLTLEQKAAFTSQIETNKASLTSMRSKVVAETDLTTLRADAKEITSSYRIFGVFVPKIHLLASFNKASAAAAKITDLREKLAIATEDAQSQGEDVADLQILLAQVQTSLDSANEKISTVESKILSVTVEGYPENKSVLIDGKNAMASVKKDLAAARADTGKIVERLKAINSLQELNPTE